MGPADSPNLGLAELPGWALPDSQGLKRQGFARDRKLGGQLRSPLVHLKVKGLEQAFGVGDPSADLAKVVQRLLAPFCERLRAANGKAFGARALIQKRVRHQGGSGGGLVGLAGGKAFPNQGLLQYRPIRFGQLQQPHPHPLGWQRLPSHRIARQRGERHSHRRGLDRGALQQGDQTAAARIEAVAGRHQLGPQIEAGAPGTTGRAAADCLLSFLGQRRWPDPQAKAKRKQRDYPQRQPRLAQQLWRQGPMGARHGGWLFEVIAG